MFKWLFGDKKDSSGIKEENYADKILVFHFLKIVIEEISEIRNRMLIDATLHYSSFHIGRSFYIKICCLNNNEIRR